MFTADTLSPGCCWLSSWASFVCFGAENENEELPLATMKMQSTPKWNTQTSTAVLGPCTTLCETEEPKAFYLLTMDATSTDYAFNEEKSRSVFCSSCTQIVYMHKYFSSTQNCKSICCIVTWLANVSCGCHTAIFPNIHPNLVASVLLSVAYICAVATLKYR